MATKIIRNDLVGKSNFAAHHGISRKFLDKIISENLLNTEVIDGLTYINISDEKVIENAICSKEKAGTWPREYHPPRPKRPKSDADAQIDTAWEKWEAENL